MGANDLVCINQYRVIVNTTHLLVVERSYSETNYIFSCIEINFAANYPTKIGLSCNSPNFLIDSLKESIEAFKLM